MNLRRLGNFFGRPTLGGWLTMLNATLSLLTAVGGTHFISAVLFLFLSMPLILLVLPAPLQVPFLLDMSWGHRAFTNAEGVKTCVVVGVNSFLWGYGMAWCCRASVAAFWRRGARRRAAGLCPSCGYSLTGNLSGVCPECGTRVE